MVALTGIECANDHCWRQSGTVTGVFSLLATSPMLRKGPYEAPTCLPGACHAVVLALPGSPEKVSPEPDPWVGPVCVQVWREHRPASSPW